jgi:hypothetical protein
MSPFLIIFIAAVVITLLWVKGITYMHDNNPDYKGLDLFSEGLEVDLLNDHEPVTPSENLYQEYVRVAGGMEEVDYSLHVDDPVNNCTRLMTEQEFWECVAKNPDFLLKEKICLSRRKKI